MPHLQEPARAAHMPTAHVKRASVERATGHPQGERSHMRSQQSISACEAAPDWSLLFHWPSLHYIPQNSWSELRKMQALSTPPHPLTKSNYHFPVPPVKVQDPHNGLHILRQPWLHWDGEACTLLLLAFGCEKGGPLPSRLPNRPRVGRVSFSGNRRELETDPRILEAWLLI